MNRSVLFGFPDFKNQDFFRTTFLIIRDCILKTLQKRMTKDEKWPNSSFLDLFYSKIKPRVLVV